MADIENENDEYEDGEMGYAEPPELCDGQCLSLAQARDMIERAISDLPQDAPPHTVPVVVAGRVENGQGEIFHLNNLIFGVGQNGEHKAFLLTDGSGRDPEIDKL